MKVRITYLNQDQEVTEVVATVSPDADIYLGEESLGPVGQFLTGDFLFFKDEFGLFVVRASELIDIVEV